MRKILLATVGISAMALLVFWTPALARDSKANEQSYADDSSLNEDNRPAARLEAAKLKVCMVHEKVINRIMERIAERGQKRLNVYNTIAERVEDFYTKKGKAIDNYNSLVTEVNDKKSAAQVIVDQIKAVNIEFKCDGSDPKGVVSSFKSDLKLEIRALHDYQQAIKDLIVGVKSAQSESAGTDSSAIEGEQQ